MPELRWIVDRLAAALVLVSAFVAANAAPALAASCADISSLAIDNTRIELAETKAAGPYAPQNSITVGALPAFCRVLGTISPVRNRQRRPAENHARGGQFEEGPLYSHQ